MRMESLDSYMESQGVAVIKKTERDHITFKKGVKVVHIPFEDLYRRLTQDGMEYTGDTILRHLVVDSCIENILKSLPIAVEAHYAKLSNTYIFRSGRERFSVSPEQLGHTFLVFGETTVLGLLANELKLTPEEKVHMGVPLYPKALYNRLTGTSTPLEKKGEDFGKRKDDRGFSGNPL